jgi:molybdopterin molybdotransferase
MPEFLRLSLPIEALQTLLGALPDKKLGTELIDTPNALERILAEDLRALHPLPEFPRSTVDGYAVRARDTFGVSESIPVYITCVGEVEMGKTPFFTLGPGKCALIHTGGMLPEGADAVVMLEFTQMVGLPAHQGHKGVGTDTGLAGNEQTRTAHVPEIEFMHAVAEGENVLSIGEDVAADQVVLEAGRRIRPAEIGGCMALGIIHLRVVIKPKIGIISTGDEVIQPEQIPLPGQVRDVNSYSLAALVKGAGGEPVSFGIVSDSLEALKAAAKKAVSTCEAVVITAGSSASARDTTAEAIASLGPPGVLVHGINVRPGKPTILGIGGGKPVIGLPGNPVSALVIARLYVIPVIEKLLGARPKPKPFVKAKLLVNIPSQAGREDWVAVKLLENDRRFKGNGDAFYLAEPVFGKSNLIFSLVAADGLVRIPPEETGISAGEIVDVELI